MLFNKIWIKLTLQTEKPPNIKAPFLPRSAHTCKKPSAFIIPRCTSSSKSSRRTNHAGKHFPTGHWKHCRSSGHSTHRPDPNSPERPGAVSPVYLFPPSRLEIHSVSHTIHFYFSSMRADLAELLHHLHKTKILLWKAALKEKGFLYMSEKFTAWQNSEFNGLPVGKNSMHHFWSIALSSHFLIYGWLRRHLS